MLGITMLRSIRWIEHLRLSIVNALCVIEHYNIDSPEGSTFMKQTLSCVRVGPATLQLLAAAALSGGCLATTPDPADGIEQSLVQQMTADSLYMMRLAAPQGGVKKPSLRIDLADPNQYRFVMNRLAAAGKSAGNAPYLFERIEKSRQRMAARASSGAMANDAGSTDWCDASVVFGTGKMVGPSSVKYVTSHPSVSCLQGPSPTVYVTVDINAYRANLAGTQATLVASASGENFDGATAFDDVTITPTFPAAVGIANRSDSLLIAYNEADNEQYTYYDGEDDLTPLPPTISFVHPVKHPGIMCTVNGCSEQLNPSPIEICQQRGSKSECDYAIGHHDAAAREFTPWPVATNLSMNGMAAIKLDAPGTDWKGDDDTYFAFNAPNQTYDNPYVFGHIFVPLQATLDVGTNPFDCHIVSINQARFELARTVTGGKCTTTNDFTNAVVTDGFNPRFANIRTLMEFPNCAYQEGIYHQVARPTLTIEARVDCGGMTAEGDPVILTRTINLDPDSSPALPFGLAFRNSCLAEGTRVRKANGATTAVEKIKAGDKVIADAKGTVLTVTQISSGGEAEPLVQLRDDKGHQVRVTREHPMIRASGEVALASAIHPGDQVMTDRGIARITAITRVPYRGRVYNFDLGTPDEKAKVGKDGTTMYAAGFLVGDNAMQREHTTLRRMVAQVPPAWQRDYAYAQAGNPSMRRVFR
jgi:hypothetical protein